MSKECAVVTGGSYEEGLSVAEAVARAGYAVTIWDDGKEALDAARSELSELGLEVDIRCLDISDVAAVTEAARAVESVLGAPVALFNMATLKNSYLLGNPDQRVDHETPFFEIDPYKLLRVVQINAIGTLLCSRMIAMGMVERGSGSIVNFSTSLKTQRSAGHIPYGPSKSFVESFSAAAAQQLSPHGVRVNAISSGGMVNRRGTSDPRHVPSDWADELVAYLAGEASVGVTAQLFCGSGLTPERDLRTL